MFHPNRIGKDEMVLNKLEKVSLANESSKTEDESAE
jgi:hypothetical protein